MRPPREDTLPWYRQFWPWFLISLPGTVVIASMITIYLAVSTRDGLVKDDYYKEGLAIHMDAARARTASDLGVRAALHYDPTGPAIEVRLNDAAVGQLPHLVVLLFHPTRDNRDQRIEMQPDGEGGFTGAVEALAPANWRVTAEPPGGQWRISGRLPVPQATRAELQ